MREHHSAISCIKDRICEKTIQPLSVLVLHHRTTYRHHERGYKLLTSRFATDITDELRRIQLLHALAEYGVRVLDNSGSKVLESGRLKLSRVELALLVGTSDPGVLPARHQAPVVTPRSR